MQHYSSDVARLLACIQDEYVAATRGLSGIATGTAQHQFINAKMERMERLHQELRTHVGEHAIALLAQTLDAAPVDAPVPLEEDAPRPG
ncbi:hypothetical protein [Dictyobacter formicarum]|uniref:Uncharacterized protein n=1 Tax=Dictyobacter formicarum TaxID=2778368 RepID=A0ABQ3VEM4_9CHLR|nr:hypothetical protein [Dictyobacter formicarum]GHO84367.1 hypothetical protein KSZ_23730 [Dictyobacter formicarum]